MSTPEDRGMEPTAYLRFVLRQVPEVTDNEGLVMAPGFTIRILQQKWRHTLHNAGDEWHDVPIQPASEREA